MNSGLLNPEARPRAAPHPVVERELRVAVLHAEHIAAAQRRAGAGLAGDVRRDSERDDVRNVAGDVDVRARHVERRERDPVACGVGDFGLLLIGVVVEDHGADRGWPGVSSGGDIARRRSDLRRRVVGNQKEENEEDYQTESTEPNASRSTSPPRHGRPRAAVASSRAYRSPELHTRVACVTVDVNSPGDGRRGRRPSGASLET